LNRDEVEEWLTQWGIYHRGHEKNHNDFDPENHVYKIEKSNVFRPYTPNTNTYEQIIGKPVGENKMVVGADPKHIDIHKVETIDKLIPGRPMLEILLLKELYINIPVNPNNRKERGESWIAKKWGVGRQVVKSVHTRLIQFIQNELELTN